jgi:hypothetical protein
MSTKLLRCLNCGRLSPAEASYCRFCGEAVDPVLIAELQWLYGALNDLDTRIARGEGAHTITALRDEYRDRYLAARRAPTAEKSAAPVWPAAVAAQPAASVAPVAPVAPAIAPTVPVAASASASAPTVPPRPAGPIFSWQAFLSEQAIAIMMYMGGFLGLVAMLSFEIGGWQSLDLGVKLGAIILVYLAFGTLGLVVRRLPRLRAVGGVYLGVFALMTPLVALGIYRFGLQAAGFSGAAMLSLSSAYAAIVYLALAWRTRFMTYAYLGWSAMIVAALAIVFWADVPRESLVFALAVVSLALIVPGLLHRFSLAALLETPALQLAAVTSLAATAGTLYLWLMLAIRAIADTPLSPSPTLPPEVSTAVYALSSCTLVLVAAAWSYLARRLSGSLEESARAGWLNVTDWLVVVAATHAAIALAAWLGADRRAMSLVLAALALAEVAVLFVLWQRARERTELRYLMEALALLLAIGGCLGVISDPAPNWPYLLALTAGMVVAAGLAVFESVPLWLLPAGVFLSLDYHALFDALFRPAINDAFASPERLATFWAVATTGLVAALVVPWLVAAPSPRAQRFALPVYLIALGNALYVTINLFGHDAIYATLILGLYVLLALLAGWRAHQPLAGGVVAGFFGALLPFPLSVAGGDSRFIFAAALTTVVVALAGLGIRGLLGRASALPMYLIALWTALVIGLRTLASPSVPTAWGPLGVPFSAWLLLAFATLATIAILWDNLTWATFVPALFGMMAAVATPGLRGVALTVMLVGAGMLLRQVRGRWQWSFVWYIAALLASLYQLLVLMVHALVNSSVSPNRAVAVALLFALVAYLAAVVERQPWVASAVPFYVFLAAVAARDPHGFVKILAITYGVVIIGLALRLSVGRRWALVAYLSAILPSLLAISRVTPNTPGVAEALLLIFAVTTYGIALVEHVPNVGIIAVAYAGLAAIVQPGAHVLLPLALALAAVGIAIGRVGGWRWAWPAYASSLLVALVTALLGVRLHGFEGWALLAFALTAYVVAMVESQAEALVLALAIGVLALAAGARALDWPLWQAALAFVGLSWLYVAGQWLWGALPWLRNRPGRPWWMDDEMSAKHASWQDVRFVGRIIHHFAGLLVGSGVALAALLIVQTYLPGEPLAEVEVVALASLAVMVALSARVIPLHALWYVSGGLLAVAVSWQVRWLGADNIQAFVLAPGSYLLIIGALLPADHRLRNPVRLGQMASLFGALLLLLPTLTQSFTTPQSENWVYAAVLALEALAIAAIGVGTHSRVLLLLGTGFFGLAAIRGALLAFSSGVPVALIIAALALLLMGGATWLSLRVRREASTAQP